METVRIELLNHNEARFGYFLLPNQVGLSISTFNHQRLILAYQMLPLTLDLETM